MLYDKYTNAHKDIDIIRECGYAKCLDILHKYTKRLNTLRKQSIELLDAIAAKAPRRVALIVDAASVQVELGSITNAATILVKSKIKELVELADKMLLRAENLYKDIARYEH